MVPSLKCIMHVLIYCNPFSVSIYQPFPVFVAIHQPPLVPLVFALCLALPCLRGPYTFPHTTARPCPTTTLVHPRQPRADQRFTVCDMRHMPSQPTELHMRNELFTSLPAPFTRCLALAAERLTTRNGCNIPNQDPKPAFQNETPSRNCTYCARGSVTISHKGHIMQCDQPPKRCSSYGRVGSLGMPSCWNYGCA